MFCVNALNQGVAIHLKNLPARQSLFNLLCIREHQEMKTYDIKMFQIHQVYFVQRAGARQFFSSPCHCLGLHLAVLVQGELLGLVQDGLLYF